MSLCVAPGAETLRVAAVAFTLSWTHSVERTEWREVWRVTPAGLLLETAQARGAGAGLEPAADARLEAGWWTWRPRLAPVPDLVLAASGATGAGWTLCAAGRCLELGAAAGPVVRIAPCPASE
jgi:hypothetical protein